MHQDEVLEVFFLRHLGSQATGHGEGADACCADQGVDLAAAEEGHQLAEEQTRDRIQAKGQQTQHQDADGFPVKEAASTHGGADGHAQEQGGNIGDLVLRGLVEPLHHAAFTQQIAQHEHADQGGGFGYQQTDGQGNYNREQDARPS